jgi:hypothetical protein
MLSTAHVGDGGGASLRAAAATCLEAVYQSREQTIAPEATCQYRNTENCMPIAKLERLVAGAAISAVKWMAGTVPKSHEFGIRSASAGNKNKEIDT